MNAKQKYVIKQIKYMRDHKYLTLYYWDLLGIYSPYKLLIELTQPTININIKLRQYMFKIAKKTNIFPQISKLK